MKTRGIHNFSDDRDIEETILSLGLKFIPEMMPIQHLDIKSALFRTQRRMVLMLHDFPEKEDENIDIIPPKLRVKSTWYPSPDQKNESQLLVEEKFDALTNDILKLKIKNQFNPKNLVSLKEIKTRSDIKVVQTDKNLGICILRTKDYHKFILKQLELPVYKCINETEIDISDWIKYAVWNRYKSKVLPLLKKYEGKFAEHERSLITYFGYFHGLPKIHKNKPFDQTPMRPIIASRPCQLQSRISVILTERLLPKLNEFDTILRDSYILKQEIEYLDCNDSIFISIDFESLYTSIPLEDLYDTIQSHENWSLEFRVQTIALLRFIFSNNYFEYADDFYQQTDGIAMGTNVAPVIANLYLALKFDRIVKTIGNINNYRRFIDDCFMIFKGNQEIFENEILPIIQDAAKPLTITHEVDRHSLNFLDLTIFNHNNKVATKIFQKPLNKYSYIPPFSKHPPATIRGFIKGEIIRYHRLSTLDKDFKEIKNLFYQRLLQRGYTENFLKEIFHGVRHRKGFLSELLHQRQRQSPNTEDDQINFVINYSSDNLSLYRYLKRHIQEIADTVFPHNEKKTVRIAYKSNPNVQKLTMRSALTNNQLDFIKNPVEVI